MKSRRSVTIGTDLRRNYNKESTIGSAESQAQGLEIARKTILKFFYALYILFYGKVIIGK